MRKLWHAGPLPAHRAHRQGRSPFGKAPLGFRRVQVSGVEIAWRKRGQWRGGIIRAVADGAWREIVTNRSLRRGTRGGLCGKRRPYCHCQHISPRLRRVRARQMWRCLVGSGFPSMVTRIKLCKAAVTISTRLPGACAGENGACRSQPKLAWRGWGQSGRDSPIRSPRPHARAGSPPRYPNC